MFCVIFRLFWESRNFFCYSFSQRFKKNNGHIMYRIVDIQFQYWYCHFKHCDFDCLVFETFESFHTHISVSDNFLWYFFSSFAKAEKWIFFSPYLRSFEVSHKLLRAIEERQAKYLNKTLKVSHSVYTHIHITTLSNNKQLLFDHHI